MCNKPYLFIVSVMLAFTGNVMSQPLEIDAGKQVAQPLMKRFGTTISVNNTISTLRNNQEALNDLQLSFIRVYTGFGEESPGKLYTQQQVPDQTGDNLNLVRAGEVAQIIAQTGAIPLYAVTFPQDWTYHKRKEDGSADFNNPIASEQPKFKNLMKNFASVIKDYYDVKPIWELLEIPQNEMNPDWQQNKSYMQIMGAASRGVQEGCASQAVPSATYATNTYWLPNHDFWLYPLLGCCQDQGGRVDGLTCSYVGYSQEGRVKDTSTFLQGMSDSEGMRYQWWTYYLDSYIPEFTAYGFNDNRTYNELGAVEFMKVAKESQKYSDVTKIGIGQLYDDNSAPDNLGLITADGVKTQLYWALYLYNRMALDCITSQGGMSGVGSLVSIDGNKRMCIALFNDNSSQVRQPIIINNLPFASAQVTKYIIDGTHSADGTLYSEQAKSVTSNEYSLTLTLDANQIVFLFFDADEESEGETAEQPVEEVEPLKGYVHHQSRWFMGRWEDPNTWCQWDRKTSTGWVGTSKNASVIAVAADYEKVPDLVLVKGMLTGQKMGTLDVNSALYIRVDYGVGSGFSQSYTQARVFYDPVNGQYNSAHESMPDGFNYGDKREAGAVEVDFLCPEGFCLDLKKYAPSDWNHNVRFMIYLQNANTPSGMMAKFQFFPASEVPEIPDDPVTPDDPEPQTIPVLKKGDSVKLEAEDFNPGNKGETWYTNRWSDDVNVDGGPDYGYYLGKGYGFGEYDSQNDIAIHNLESASNGRYLFGMGSFWHDSYGGGNAVNGRISFEEARNWWGCWFDYDFEVEQETEASIDLSASSPHTVWRINIDRNSNDRPGINPDYVQVESLPDGASWVGYYSACAQVMLDGQMLVSNQDKLPTIVHPSELFGDNFWASLGGDDGLAEGQREWMQRVWDDGYATPSQWTKPNPDPQIVYILPNASSAESIKDVNQNHYIDTYESSFGYPLYNVRLTPGKHTIRLYSLAQKWYFDYILIKSLSSSDDTDIAICSSAEQAKASVFTVDGRYVGCNLNGLKSGIYIVRQGASSHKVTIR